MGKFVPGDSTPWFEVTQISQLGIWLLVDNEEFFLAYEQFPWFHDAPVKKILNVERPTPLHFRWPDLDVDLELDAIRYPEKFPLLARREVVPGILADALRAFYNYHFIENQKIWDHGVMALSDAQFVQEVPYGIGSIRNHTVHLINVENNWFSGLRGVEPEGNRQPEECTDRAEIRTRWDGVISLQRAYLDALTDEIAASKPFAPEEDDEVYAWQLLLHVTHHGTDHRSQMLRILNEFGVATWPQDYAFYLYRPQDE